MKERWGEEAIFSAEKNSKCLLISEILQYRAQSVGIYLYIAYRLVIYFNDVTWPVRGLKVISQVLLPYTSCRNLVTYVRKKWRRIGKNVSYFMRIFMSLSAFHV